MQNKRPASPAGLIFVLVLITAILLLRWIPGPHAESSFNEDYVGVIGHAYFISDGSPIQSSGTPPEVVGSVHGLVLDENDSPIRGVEVELIPTNKTGDARWYATEREWTGADGQYQFNHAEPGEYLVAVQKRAAPDGRHPFTVTYYTDAEDESNADRVFITESSSTELQPMQLRRLETMTLKVSVSFEDGTRPHWSNLLFHNLSYPDQGVIGDEAPGIEDGQGEFTLPKGFEYYAQATVDCEGASRIETLESKPIQQIKIEDGLTPEELTFTIPGPACKLWSPK